LKSKKSLRIELNTIDADVCKISPSDWMKFPLFEVCEKITSGATPSRKHPEFFNNGKWPWVKTKELNDDWIEDTEEKITDDAIESSSAKILPKDTILLAMYGATVGQLGILKRSMSCNQACCAITTNENLANYRFIYYQLLLHRSQLKQLAVGAAQQNLSVQLIQSLRFPFPSINKQKNISSILGTIDDKIKFLKTQNIILEKILQTIFKSQFIDFNVQTEFIDSELDNIPKNWEIKQISDCCVVKRGASPRPMGDPKYFGGKIPWIKISDVTKSRSPFVFSTKKTVTDAGKEKSVFLKAGSLIVSNSATCGLPVFLGKDGCIHDGWLYFINLEKISQEFLYFLILKLQKHLVNIADGSVQKNLNTKIMGMQKFVLPPDSLIKDFTKLSKVIFNSIQKNEIQIRKLSSIFSSLLPKLLSGEIRV